MPRHLTRINITDPVSRAAPFPAAVPHRTHDSTREGEWG